MRDDEDGDGGDASREAPWRAPERVCGGAERMDGEKEDAAFAVLKGFVLRRKRRRQEVEEEKEAKDAVAPSPPLTEMEKQVVGLKEKYPDMLLLLECGYRMRLFGEDAETAARILGIRAQRHRVFVEASVPVHRTLFHARRLVRCGLKVGIVRQTSSTAMRSIAPAGQKNARQPLERDVVQVFTRGTIPDEDDWPEGEALAADGEETADGDAEDKARERDAPPHQTRGRDAGVHAARFVVALVEETVATTTLFARPVHELSNRHEAALRTAESVRIGVFGYDVHTGEWVSDDFIDDGKRSKLREYLQNVVPVELVFPEAGISPLSEQVVGAYVEQQHASSHSDADCRSSVPVYRALAKTQAVGLHAVKGFPAVTQAAVSVLDDHFHKLKMSNILTESSLVQSRNRSCLVESTTCLRLSLVASIDLGIFKDDVNDSSLFDVLEHTKTATGARRLRDWLSRPLVDLETIEARQDAVSYLAEVSGDGAVLFEDLRDHVLPAMSPVERLLQQLHMGRATPSSAMALLKSLSELDLLIEQMMEGESGAFHKPNHLVHQRLSQLPRLRDELPGLLSRISTDAWDTKDLERAMAHIWPHHQDDHIVYQAILSELDKLNEEYDTLLSSYREQLEDATLIYSTYRGGGIGKAITRVVVVMKAKISRVPPDWLVVSSSKASVKYLPSGTRELLFQEDVLNEKKEQVVKAVWLKTLQLMDSTLYAKSSMLVDGLAELDALCSLAAVVRQYPNYVRPEFSRTKQLVIKCGRHPVLEVHGPTGSNYIASSVDLTQAAGASLLISGPNMGGKSTLLRMAGVLVIMAQIGSFVPADSMVLSSVDAVFTRMHRRTANALPGCEEVRSIATISQQATPSSLVLLDEIGFGLTTKQAKALAISTVNYLVQNVRCYSLVATHVPEVVHRLRILSSAVVAVELSHGIDNSELNHDEPTGDGSSRVVYYYTTRDGVATRSLPIEAAIAASLPHSIIKAAQEQSSDR